MTCECCEQCNGIADPVVIEGDKRVCELCSMTNERDEARRELKIRDKLYIDAVRERDNYKAAKEILEAELTEARGEVDIERTNRECWAAEAVRFQGIAAAATRRADELESKLVEEKSKCAKKTKLLIECEGKLKALKLGGEGE